MSKVLEVKTLGLVKPCSVRGCKDEGAWTPTVNIPYQKRDFTFTLYKEPMRLATATLDVQFCSNHKRGIDPRELINIGLRAFWTGNDNTKTAIGTGVSLTWEKTNPGVVITN